MFILPVVPQREESHGATLGQQISRDSGNYLQASKHCPFVRPVSWTQREKHSSKPSRLDRAAPDAAGLKAAVHPMFAARR